MPRATAQPGAQPVRVPRCRAQSLRAPPPGDTAWCVPRRGTSLECDRHMIDLGWSAPTKRLDAGTAREAILAQHHRIRSLLGRARGVAEAALDGEAPAPDAV